MVQVSVIIPARDAAATLGACLDALAGQAVPGANAELIVVDDCSHDQTRTIAQRPNARVLHGAGRGPAVARNLGARCAQDARLERARRIDFVDTGTAAYRRDAFLSSGGFDESFPAQSAEDVELAFRLSAAGARFVFNPRAGVCHRHAETLSAYLLKKMRYGFFRVAVYRRHPRKALGDSYTPPVMAVQIGLVACSWLFGVLLIARPRSALRWALAGVLGAFGMTTVALASRAAADGFLLMLSVPLLVYARSAAQGVGILIGLGRLVLERMVRQRQSPPASSSGQDELPDEKPVMAPSRTGVYAGV